MSIKSVGFTVAQKQRLSELNGSEELCNQVFENAPTREKAFKQTEHSLIEENKDALFALKNQGNRPLLLEVETRLVRWLTEQEGFTQVVTPIILPAPMLAKMTVGENHPLHKQVFWLDEKRCLRPMLAPNLYDVMRSLQKVWGDPVRIFESGPCFRKESQGAMHLNEFTMLNFVELAGVQEGEQMARLEELAHKAMAAVGIEDYKIVKESSVVYGETLDVEVKGVEIASGAYGPHFLDSAWGIFDTWVGIGFGLERIAMVMQDYHNIKRVGRSLAYLNGARLNI